MNKLKSWVCSAAIALLLTTLIPINSYTTEKAKPKKEESARVAILPYANTAKNKNYQWLQESLPAAIKEAMAERFIFDNASPEMVKEAGRQITALEVAPSLTELQNISVIAEAEIIICGSYSCNIQENTVTISSLIWLSGSSNELKSISTTAKLDSSIFGVTDQVSAEITDYIAAKAAEGEKLAEPEAAATVTNETKPTKKERISLKSNIGKHLAEDTHTLRAGVQLNLGLADFTEHRFGIGLSALYLYNIRGNILIGAAAEPLIFFNTGSATDTDALTGTYYVIPVVAVVGYSLGLTERLRANCYLGAGLMFQLMTVKYPQSDDIESSISPYISPTLYCGLGLPLTANGLKLEPFLSCYLHGTPSDGKTLLSLHCGLALRF